MTIRAVHIEMTESTTTDSTLNGIRCFMARRGCPQEFYCDNGQNFCGCERELRELAKNLYHDELQRSLSEWLGFRN